MSQKTNHMTELFREVQRAFVPLSVGYDSFFEDTTNMIHNATGYPPYNLLHRDGETVIEVALAGLSPKDIKLFVEKDVLHISYEKPLSTETKAPRVAYQGIATRNFDLAFHIAQGVVVNNAVMKEGLLRISLNKVQPPEPVKNFVEIRTE